MAASVLARSVGSALTARYLAAAAMVLAVALPPAAAQQAGVVDATQIGGYRVVNDAIPESLSGTSGDPSRGRTIVASRQAGLCLLCHTAPLPEERFQGDLAPDLRGTGTRWSEGQLRLRIVDSRRINPGSIMPAYYRSEGLTRVGPSWQGKTVLNAQQIEDVVAFLKTLRD
jgi:L-cysteine S-thiosulfotransferase